MTTSYKLDRQKACTWYESFPVYFKIPDCVLFASSFDKSPGVYESVPQNSATESFTRLSISTLKSPNCGVEIEGFKKCSWIHGKEVHYILYQLHICLTSYCDKDVWRGYDNNVMWEQKLSHDNNITSSMNHTYYTFYSHPLYLITHRPTPSLCHLERLKDHLTHTHLSLSTLRLHPSRVDRSPSKSLP